MKQVDSEYLLNLARQKSAESRSILGKTMSDLFMDTNIILTDTEREMMFDILHGIFHEIEMSIRKAFGEQLSEAEDVPNELLKLLANDDIEVAYPVLTKSRVLRDEALIEVIQQRTREHMLAIAQREHVSERVTDELVDKGDVNVIETLLKNQFAEISEGTLEYIAEQSKRVNAYREPILNRRDLSADLAKRMFLWVSAALRKHIIENFNLDQSTVDDLLEQAAYREVEAYSGEEESKSKTDKLAGHMQHLGIVTYDMMIKTLRDGEISLFVSMICQKTSLRQQLVLRILFEPGGEGLAIICKAIGMDKVDYGSIFSISRIALSSVAKEGFVSLEDALDFYERFTREEALKVVHRWQHSSDFLAAIRDLEMTFGPNQT